MQTEVGGGGHDDLIRIAQEIHRERFFHHGNAQAVAGLQHMGLGNAAQNQLIVRVGIENPVFQH